MSIADRPLRRTGERPLLRRAPSPATQEQPGVHASRQPAGPRWLAGGSIPALDGLRAGSIALVVLAHASLSWSSAPDHSAPLVRLGSIGVDLFFVISGFLITWLLLREQRRTARISIRAFYVRRAFRILPAYLTFLACLLVMTWLGMAQLNGRDWAGALTYTVNFLPGTSWPAGHLWSLSVEEHFYLLWPLLLLLLGPRRGAVLAAAYVVIAPGLRLLMWRCGIESLDIDYCTPARIDTIAAGCLLAYLADNEKLRRRLILARWWSAAAIFVLLLACLVISNTVLTTSGLYTITIHRTVDAICFAGLVWTGVSHTDGWLAAVLNAKPLVWIGRLSYGIYLWQQPLLNPHSEHPVCQWPVNIALALACATLSYALIERPMLRLREQRGWGRVAGA